MTDWLDIRRGTAPLIVAMPHGGSEIPREIERRVVSPWLARKDADWWIDDLYGFAAGLGATVVRTTISRTVIDCNRDPSGASLYPGQATTGLCPTTSFDGEALYLAGAEPSETEIFERRRLYFEPYHAALAAEIARLRGHHGHVVLYDAHSIRSQIPRLFDGSLPHLNIGSNRGASCDDALTTGVAKLCAASDFSHVVNGRFVGGWTTRHYGRPGDGVHALQMELACRGYIDEPDEAASDNWPTPFDPARAAPLAALLTDILQNCIDFAQSRPA
jgi:N-formylglutamate deformylase